MWFIITAVVVVLLFGFVVFRGAPYVPSRKRDVQAAFDNLYAVGPSDTLVDIGSGDGIVLRMAAERGARAVGYELNPLLLGISRLLSRGDARVTVRLADAWHVDLPAETTIVYIFSTSRDIEKLGRWLDEQATKNGNSYYFMSYGFELQRSSLRKYGAHHLYEINPLQLSTKNL